MATFRTALTRLTSLTVPGITHSFDISTLPDDISRVQLPALLPLPVEVDENVLFREQGEGFTAVAFSDGPRTVTYTLTHLLLVAPIYAGHGLRSHLPGLVDLIDNYCATIAQDVTLTGALLQPMQVRIELGTFQHGKTEYHGCAFRHRWLLEITP